MDGVIDLLVNGSPMAAFAIFLIYLYTTMQKRMDVLVSKFQEQLQTLRAEYKEDTEELRVRYDKVVVSLNDERTAIRINLADKVGKVAAQIQGVDQNVDSLPFDALQIQIESVSMAQRNTHLLLEKGMELVQEMRDQAKMQDMARKLSDREA